MQYRPYTACYEASTESKKSSPQTDPEWSILAYIEYLNDYLTNYLKQL